MHRSVSQDAQRDTDSVHTQNGPGTHTCAKRVTYNPTGLCVGSRHSSPWRRKRARRCRRCLPQHKRGEGSDRQGEEKYYRPIKASKGKVQKVQRTTRKVAQTQGGWVRHRNKGESTGTAKQNHQQRAGPLPMPAVRPMQAMAGTPGHVRPDHQAPPGCHPTAVPQRTGRTCSTPTNSDAPAAHCKGKERATTRRAKKGVIPSSRGVRNTGPPAATTSPPEASSNKQTNKSAPYPQKQATATLRVKTYRSNWLVTLFSYNSGYLTPCALRANPTFDAIHINTNQFATAVKMTAP